MKRQNQNSKCTKLAEKNDHYFVTVKFKPGGIRKKRFPEIGIFFPDYLVFIFTLTFPNKIFTLIILFPTFLTSVTVPIFYSKYILDCCQY